MRIELDEMEKNNRKRLAEAPLQEFEMPDAVSKCRHSETTANARISMRCEKAVQDWMNTSPALNFSKGDKTGEPVVTNDPRMP